MKNVTTFLLSLVACCLFACGGNTAEEHDAESYDGTMESQAHYPAAASGQYGGEAENFARTKYAERRAKGDTLAIHYKELQKFLPTEIKGYSRYGEMDGGSINMENISYSTASQRYRKGDSELTITLMDYNNAFDMYEGLTGAWASGMSYEDDNQKTNGVSLLDNKVKGVESFAKNSRRGDLMAGITSRFFLQIAVENTDNPSLCKEIAEGMDLRALDAY